MHSIRSSRHIDSTMIPRLLSPGLTLYLFLLLLLNKSSCGISIDNDIIGEPDIECLDQEIRVWVKTRKLFAGRIYAKGKSEDPECSKDDFAARRTKKPHFDLPLGMCGMRSLRSFDPRGMYYGITLVISFHPLFITKVDQAFHVKCFFEEANRGLTAELGVSMLPTTEVEARHGIPGCTYSIHRSSIDDLDAGRPAGPPIQFARVGDKVLHQWHCDDKMFGVLINNCYVTDGVKLRAEVIDSHGCPVDPILITGIRYSSDMQRAYAESQVFKFADRPGIWFFCQIQMCMKKEQMCQGITPPSCATSGNTGVAESTSSKGSRPGPDRGVAGRERGRPGNDAGGSRSNNGDGDYEGNGENGSSSSISSSTAGIRPASQRGSSRHGGGADNAGGDYGGGTELENGDGADIDSEYGSGSLSPTTYSLHGRNKVGKNSNTRLPQRQREGGGNNPYDVQSGYNGDATAANENESAGRQAVTVFGPAYSPEVVADGYGEGGANGARKVASEADPLQSTKRLSPPTTSRRQEVTTEFQTDDDLDDRRMTKPSAATATKTTATTSSTTRAPSPSHTISPTTRGGAAKKDYVDYDSDVTIPPNLTDLLANLPQDISADSLQKMFRDSVADRRALLQGFDLLMNKDTRIRLQMREEDTEVQDKIQTRRTTASGSRRQMRLRPIGPPSAMPSPVSDMKILGMRRDGDAVESENGDRRLPPGHKIDTMHVTWDSAQQHRLARDLPLIKDSGLGRTTSDSAGQKFSVEIDPPMIAGQLLIYDLDETPPPLNRPHETSRGTKQQRQCVITRQGLFALVMCLASSAASLFIIFLIFYVRLRRQIRDRGDAWSSSSAPSRTGSAQSLDCKNECVSTLTSASRPQNNFLQQMLALGRKSPPPNKHDLTALSIKRNASGVHKTQ